MHDIVPLHDLVESDKGSPLEHHGGGGDLLFQRIVLGDAAAIRGHPFLQLQLQFGRHAAEGLLGRYGAVAGVAHLRKLRYVRNDGKQRVSNPKECVRWQRAPWTTWYVELLV